MKNILLILIPLLTFSCQKVIDISPKAGEQKVIIQGYLFADSTVKVIVTKSTDYLSTTPPPHIASAVITLSDNHGATEVLTWNPIKMQHESATMKGVVGDTYTLKVELEGKTYNSTSVLPDLSDIDSITVTKEPAQPPFIEEGYYMKLYATIPVNQKLYYLFKGYANDSLLNDVNNINYANNDNLNGEIKGINMGYEYEVGEEAKLEIYSLTKAAYDFYNAASLQLNNDGGFFSTPPANVPSMFDNDAVGLFQCSKIQVAKTEVLAQ
ncbi:MAG: DUF4249 domain-containing protein [Cytophaga sp.]|uniref:DUF4249 domain-containing protein n=1 Tax=Cytophaga sp. TaxID=29535 RepID=UPI003F7FB26B